MSNAITQPTLSAKVHVSGDVLEKFEQFRHHECRDDQYFYRPAQVEVPPADDDAETRLLRYIENAEAALSQERKPTFRSEAWGTRGFVGFSPFHQNSISTGTYFAGSVVLFLNDANDMELVIYFDDFESASLAHAQRRYIEEVKHFLET